MALCECGCGQETRVATRTNTNVGQQKGRPLRFIVGHNSRKAEIRSYRILGYVKVHRLRAEKALGRALPPKAVVHHADGSKSEFAPLIICQDQAYHSFLHVRMRVKAAGGDPNLHRICSDCKAVTLMADMAKCKSGVSRQCKACLRLRYQVSRDRMRIASESRVQ